MEIFLRKHTEGVLAACAVVLLVLMVGCFLWGITYISQSFDNVFSPVPVAAQSIDFNLSGAKSLNLRGLVPNQ
jgi:hypothetical protein